MQSHGPYVFAINNRTGRVEVYKDTPKGGARLVGSMPGDPTDEEIREMLLKLQADKTC